MSKFIETALGKDMFDNLMQQAKEYETATTDDEKAVAEQKSLLYKLWCGLWYGHLLKNGVCLRCGYKPNKK